MMVASGALRFSGRVAIVTGAGGGLGREYALLLAERGAAVVVNDLGVDRGGTGKSSSAADKVVKEITSKGGKAVADYHSVEDGEKIVKTAIDNFGRIDILINNAGILRDRSFVNITENDWDLIHRVHLRGSFLVTKAAWPYFRKQKYGRIIMTSSAAGIFGNFGQTNYSSAKLGLLGLSNTLAIEGNKYGIHCNTIVPMAASRLTQDILPPDMFEQMKPVYVGPVVAWLCHEDCPDTGGVFEAAGGWVGKYRWQRSIGKAFIPPTNLTPESVRDNWSAITDMTDATAPTNISEQTVQLAESLSGHTPAPKRERAAAQAGSEVYVFEQDSPILYALAVGMSTKEPSYLNFLYEGSDNFQVLPTFGTIMSMPAIFGSPALQEQTQKLNADPSKLLHGEQYLELYGPLPSSGAISTSCRVLDVLDKGSGAVVIVEADSFNENKQKVAYSQWTVFLVGAGGFGGKRTTDKAKTVLPVPHRKPDAVIEEKTSEDQAALYRLCGDKNPIHIDPNFAAMGGFSTPILHGLCSLGYSTRHVLKQYTNYDVKLFKSVMARFANPILPGHTLRTEMWREGNRIHFQSLAVETGKLVVSGAYVDLKGTVNGPNLNAGNIPMPVADGSPALKSDDVFAFMKQQLADMPELASKIQAVYEWNITKNGKPASVWTVDLKTGNGRIVKGTISDLKPGCTLIIDDDNMMAMVSGKLDPQKAFMSGKLKLKGNIMLTQKLRPLLQMKGSSAGSPAASSSANPQVASVKSEPAVELKSDKGFLDMQQKLKKDPELASTTQTVYQWNVLKNGKHVSTWTLDLKNDVGAVYRGVPKGDKPDCVFIMEDDLLIDIMNGKADPQKAFMSGKLKITGNVLASQKLHSLWENPRVPDHEEMEFTSSTTGTTLHAPSTPAQPPAEVPAAVKSDFVFEIFAERLNEEPELAKKMKVIYNWNILRGGKKVSEWTVDLKTGSGSIYRGSPKTGKADVTITMDDEDVIQLMLGKLNPQKAFMTGRLKIKGNIMLTQKLNQLWQEIIKSGRAVELPILSAILADKPFDPTLRSETQFVELGKRISRMPELLSTIQTVYHWNITKNGVKQTEWILDLKTGKGMLYRAPARNVKPTCTLTVDDDMFSDWVSGKLPGRQVISSGRLKMEGDSSKVAKLMDSFKPQAKL